MSKKKTLKRVFHGLFGVLFFQKKKVFVDNIKHSGDEKDISLVKSVTNSNMYSDMDSVSGNNRDDDIFLGVNDDSLFGLVANTSKAKKINTGLVCGSPLGSINYNINKNNGPLSLDRKWVDLKIIKTQVEVFIKKSFALDINLSAVKEKSATAKTQLIKKIF
ncbi:hypothetical protein G9A89_012644 [Geosiphon pyriformis]|nr:hypothetical protein G9A89_012644 [Geosiphon pyriformis]